MKTLTISEVGSLIAISIPTLRRWDRGGSLTPDFRTTGGHRRYLLDKVKSFMGLGAVEASAEAEKPVVLYSRVSSSKQKDDWERQAIDLRSYAKDNGIKNFIEIGDVGSGLNFKKRGFTRLLLHVLQGKVSEVVVAHKDRLLRFGVDMFSTVCRFSGIKLTIIDSTNTLKSPSEELAADMLSVCASFACKTNGLRAAANRRQRHLQK